MNGIDRDKLSQGDHGVLKRLFKLMIKFDQSGFSEKFQKTLGAHKAQKPPRAHIMVHGPDDEGGKPLKT